MFNLISFLDPWSEVSPNRSLKHLQHECEERPRKGCIPTPLGRFISNEGVLSLYLQKRACNVGVFERLPDEITARTWYVRILLSEDHNELSFYVTLSDSLE